MGYIKTAKFLKSDEDMPREVAQFMFKKVEIWIVYLTALLGLLFAIFFGILVRQELVSGTKFGVVSEAALFLAEMPATIKAIIQKDEDLKADKKKRFTDTDKSGFVGTPNLEPSYLLLSRYDGDKNEGIVELVDLKNFDVLHTWNPKIDEMNELVDHNNPHFINLSRDVPETRYILRHPILFADGSLLFNHIGPLRKIDYCGELIWQNQEKGFHHSNEVDHEGNIWVPSRIYPYAVDEKYVGKTRGRFSDDGIAKLSPEGEILFEKSVSQILIENDMKYLLFGTGNAEFTRDPIHLNDIQPVFTDGPHWKTGDVFLSLRHQSMALLYRPSTDELLWVGTGHMYYQHDINILNDHQISIFNNNVMNVASGTTVIGNNEVLIYDFNTDTYKSYLKNSMLEHDVRTTTAGRSEILPNGDLIVEETNFSRTLYFNSDGSLRWEHINRARDGDVYRIKWSRLLHTASDIDLVHNFLNTKQDCLNG